MIIEEKVYLEHFGKKGMHWGIRNKKPKPTLTAAQRQKRRERRVNTGVTVLKVAIIAAWVAAFLGTKGKTKATSYKSYTNSNSYKQSYKQHARTSSSKVKSAKDLINDRRNVEVASLKRMHTEGKMDAAQQENFLKILNARYDRKVAAAI